MTLVSLYSLFWQKPVVFLSSRACTESLGWEILDTQNRNVDTKQGLMIPLVNTRMFRAVEFAGGHTSCEVSPHSAGRMACRSGAAEQEAAEQHLSVRPEHAPCSSLTPGPVGSAPVARLTFGLF